MDWTVADIVAAVAAMPPRPIVLSFSGSGHLLCYQLGAAQKVLASSWAQRITKFAGASGGAIAAAACALLPFERLREFAENEAIKGRAFNAMSDALHGNGPFSTGIEEAVKVVNRSQSLFLSATHCRTGRSALFSNFRSPAELQRCVLASAAIPRGFHPFDLLRSRPTYPEGSGIVIDPSCEWDGGAAAADDAVDGTLPFSPHGEAYVDGGLSDSAPRLPPSIGVDALTITPISGPQGRLVDGPPSHFHLAPLDDSPRVPLIAPRLAGMRVYLSRDNLQAFGASLGASPRKLEDWHRRGELDAERFLREHPEPP